MTRRTCGQCGQHDHHRRDCPEMFWPDGSRRDEPRKMPPRTDFDALDPHGFVAIFKQERAEVRDAE